LRSKETARLVLRPGKSTDELTAFVRLRPELLQVFERPKLRTAKRKRSEDRFDELLLKPSRTTSVSTA